jgi:hypothetical protein
MSLTRTSTTFLEALKAAVEGSVERVGHWD